MTRMFSQAGATLRALFAIALVAVTLAGCSAQVELLAAIPEQDANEVIAALATAGITATKVPGKEGMVGITVPQNDTARAVDTLRAQGLPREQFTGMGQVFKKDGLISSPMEERARYLAALSQDLSATLTRIDGVIFARVHLVLPERGAAGEKDQLSTAAVFIKHQAGYDLDILQPQVRRLVVNSIPGLALERVSVVLVPSAATKPDAAVAYASVLGVRVANDAVTRFAVLIGVLVILLLAALGGAGYLAWRQGLLPVGRPRNGDDEAA